MMDYRNLQPASFIPVDAVIPGYSANQARIAQGQVTAQQNAAMKKREAIGTQIDTGAAEELAKRNEATSMRQNQNAMLNREGTRAGGGRYRRRGLFSPGGSGLDKANSAALVEARKKAAYANFDAGEAAKAEAESKAAMNAYANRFIGFKNGALYL
jgi:hypothetical protein